MELKKIWKQVGFSRQVVGYEEVPCILEKCSKTKAREAIEREVFDDKDAIADNGKMISLMMTMMSRLYDVMDETNKSALDPADRALIEYTFEKFKLTDTRADVQFAEEGGIETVDKLLERQGRIGEIVKGS